ncbi:MAG TPA: hypothetical protein VGT61_13470 [Thermomicrobiales bacterium]|jgi:hypothetical protein|nr:hypothetical protein [Thermomicrobiales bacterium]
MTGDQPPGRDAPPHHTGQWRRFRPEPATIAGILAGVALYLVFFLGLGEIGLGFGIAAVLILIALLIRSFTAARDARRRAIEREREWYRR